MLNYALYAADKRGNRTEFAVFTNNLGVFDQTLLQAEFQGFIKKILNSSTDNQDIINILKKIK